MKLFTWEIIFLNLLLRLQLWTLHMRAQMVCTGWLYQLLQKHLLIYSNKLHLNDFYATPLPLSHADIWYLVSNNPYLCQISCETVHRKKAQIGPHSDALILNCEAQGKGRARGGPRKVTQRLFIDCGWWMVGILSLMLYIKFGRHHHHHHHHHYRDF